MTDPTPDELSQWITENIMGECIHKNRERVLTETQGEFLGEWCQECKTRSHFQPIIVKSYATDLNLAMKAYWKYAETAIQPSMIIKLKFGSVLVTISCSVLTQRIDYFSTGTSGGEATAICLAIKKTWDGREP